MRRTVASLNFVSYRHKMKFYHKRREQPARPNNVPHNVYRDPKIDPKLKSSFYVDEEVDLTARDNLEESESMRHPRERDYYQDHTYHNTWENRKMEVGHKRQLIGQYSWMEPGFQKDPWIWYPGDTVEVVTGEATGARGTIVAVVAYRNEIIVQNVNVQDVTIPATDTRPEQIVQREHPISVELVKHVDPSTNEVTDLRVVTVRNKESGATEKRRVSLASGVILPIPEEKEEVNTSPLHDTPYQDAVEETYDREKELDILAKRKLRAMEDYFVERLKAAHEYHVPLQAANEQELRTFQRDVVDRADEKLLREIASGLGETPAWWQEEINQAFTSAEEGNRSV